MKQPLMDRVLCRLNLLLWGSYETVEDIRFRHRLARLRRRRKPRPAPDHKLESTGRYLLELVRDGKATIVYPD